MSTRFSLSISIASSTFGSTRSALTSASASHEVLALDAPPCCAPAMTRATECRCSYALEWLKKYEETPCVSAAINNAIEAVIALAAMSFVRSGSVGELQPVS